MKTKILYLGAVLVALFLSLTINSPVMADVTIAKYSQVSKKMVGLFTAEYTYRAKLTNDTENSVTASATLISSPASSTIVDDSLDFGEVGVGETVTSFDTFTIRGSLFLPFYLSKLEWEIDTSISYPDADEDGVPDDYDLCDGTSSSDTANRCGCSSNDYLSRDTIIDDEGFYHFTLNPLNNNPIIIKTLKENARILENGFYVTGTVYVDVESGDDIPIKDAEIYLEYGDGGAIYGLQKIYGSVTRVVPDITLLTDMPLAYRFWLEWLETAGTSKAEIGMDFGANLDTITGLPLDDERSYLYFKYTVPVGVNGAFAAIDTILDPNDPAFLFKYVFTSANEVVLSTLSFGVSYKGKIPFEFSGWEDEGTDGETDTFFDRFTETLTLPEDDFDWLGTEFEGFKGFDDDLEFGAQLFYEGTQTFSALPGEITVEGAFYTNFDPDKDGVFPIDKDLDYMIATAGKMEITLNLLNISRIGLDASSNAVISVKEDEKALYFHGVLEQSSELNLGLNTILPINLSESASIEASGLIDVADPSRDFLRLKGDLALDFEAGALDGMGIPEDQIALLKSFGRVTGEVRINQNGIWLQGQLEGGGTAVILSLEAEAMVELFVDLNAYDGANNSYLKMYGEVDSSFGATIKTTGLFSNVPDTMGDVRLTSNGSPLVYSSASVGLILRQEGLFIGGKVDTGVDFFSAVEFTGSVEGTLFIDFYTFEDSYLELLGEIGLALDVGTLNLYDNANTARIKLSPLEVLVEGTTQFNFLDVKTVTFAVSGEISAPACLALTGVYTDELDLGFVVTTSTLSLSIDTCPGVDEPNVSINSDSTTSFTSTDCDVTAQGEFLIGWDSEKNQPKVDLTLNAAGLAESAINCIESLATEIYKIGESIFEWFSGGSGGCVLAGAPVEMADGSFKAIEDIKSGEMVMTTHGPRRVALNDVAVATYPHELLIAGISTYLTIEHGIIWEDGSIVAYDVDACQSAMPGIDVISEIPEAAAAMMSTRALTDDEASRVYNLILEWDSADDAYNLGYYVNGIAVTDFIHPYLLIQDYINPVARWVADNKDEILTNINIGDGLTLAERNQVIEDYISEILFDSYDDIVYASVTGDDSVEFLRSLSTLPEEDSAVLWKVAMGIGRILLAQ